MKNKPIVEFSNEELISNEKKLKAVTTLLMVSIPLLFLSTVFLTFKEGFSPLTVIPLALIPILVLNVNKWNQLKKEKTNRNL